MHKDLTLCVVVRGDEILFGMKKRGFGAGLWNGFGGKVAEGETIEQAAARELTEEAGIVPAHLTPCGELDFHFHENPTVHKVHIFFVKEFTGEVREGEEMRPQWYRFANIPFYTMWKDDRFWLPAVLRGMTVVGDFTFDQNNEIVHFMLRAS